MTDWMEQARRRAEQQRLAEEQQRLVAETNARQQRDAHDRQLQVLEANTKQFLRPFLQSIRAHQLLLDCRGRYKYGEVSNEQLTSSHKLSLEEIAYWSQILNPPRIPLTSLFATWVNRSVTQGRPAVGGSIDSHRPATPTSIDIRTWRIGVRCDLTHPPLEQIKAFFETERLFDYYSSGVEKPKSIVRMEEILTRSNVGSIISKLQEEIVKLGPL